MFLRIVVGFVLVLVQISAQQQPCVRDRLYPVENNGCKQFYICQEDGLFSVPRDCGPGTLFDEVQQRCEHTYTVNCAQTARIGGCVDGPTQISNCRNFTLCFNNIAYNLACGRDTVYSPSLRICTWPERLLPTERQFCGVVF